MSLLVTRHRFLYDDPAVLGPRFAGLGSPDLTTPSEPIADDEFDVVGGAIETSIVDMFDVAKGGGVEILQNIKDFFYVFLSPAGFDDTFDVYPPALRQARGIPELDDDPTTEAVVRRSGRIQMPIGKVDVS